MEEPFAEELAAPPSSEHRRFTVSDWAVFAFLAGTWGASFFFIEIGLRAFAPGLVTWIRILTGAAVVALLPGARGVAIAARDRRSILLLSVTSAAVPFTLFPLAQRHVTSAVAGVINGGVPLMVVVVGYLAFRRVPARHQVVGLVLGVVGVATIAVLTAEEGSSEAFAVALLLVAIGCYGISINLMSVLVPRYGAIPVVARSLALACIWSAPLGIWSIPRSSFAWPSLVSCLVLGAAGTGVAYAAMGRLIDRVGSVRASYVTDIVPVVALVLAAAILHEDVPPGALVGAALVVSGAVLVSRPRASRSGGSRASRGGRSR
jgi:drug/metabolite transporter (DMT)-like permease